MFRTHAMTPDVTVPIAQLVAWEGNPLAWEEAQAVMVEVTKMRLEQP
jgi:hypothetical protein